MVFFCHFTVVTRVSTVEDAHSELFKSLHRTWRTKSLSCLFYDICIYIKNWKNLKIACHQNLQKFLQDKIPVKICIAITSIPDLETFRLVRSGMRFRKGNVTTIVCKMKIESGYVFNCVLVSKCYKYVNVAKLFCNQLSYFYPE